MGGGGHHDHHHHAPSLPHTRILANKSGLCPPDFHYARGASISIEKRRRTSLHLERGIASARNHARIAVTCRLYCAMRLMVAKTLTQLSCWIAEVWYPHGGFYPDPKGWRGNLALAFGAAGLLYYVTFQYSIQQERRLMAPKAWIPSLLWNSNVPDPIDFRGRKLDRHTGKPVDAGEDHHH